MTSVGASVADCSRQLVQRTKMRVGPDLIVSVVVRIDTVNNYTERDLIPPYNCILFSIGYSYTKVENLSFPGCVSLSLSTFRTLQFTNRQ